MFPARQRKAQQGSTARHSAARHNMQSRRCNPIMRSAEACCCIQTGCVEMVQGGCKRTTRLAWHCKLLLVPPHLRKAVVNAYAGLVLYWHAGQQLSPLRPPAGCLLPLQCCPLPPSLWPAAASDGHAQSQQRSATQRPCTPAVT